MLFFPSGVAACSHVVVHLAAVPPEEVQEEVEHLEARPSAGEDILLAPLTAGGLQDGLDPLLPLRGWHLHLHSLISNIRHQSRTKNT